MRIVSGALKGRSLAAPPGQGTRPTSDRARQAVFNILEHAAWAPPLAGARVIDLFAGSGALGFEALSRGAAFCLFVETDAAARGVIRDNAEAFRPLRPHPDPSPRRHRPWGAPAPTARPSPWPSSTRPTGRAWAEPPWPACAKAAGWRPAPSPSWETAPPSPPPGPRLHPPRRPRLGPPRRSGSCSWTGQPG
jgi:hypothetical protein